MNNLGLCCLACQREPTPGRSFTRGHCPTCSQRIVRTGRVHVPAAGFLQVYDEWRENAACGNHDRPEIFFAADTGDYAEALALCEACPVRADCLADAIRTGDPHGVRGGLYGKELRRLLRKARRTAA